LSGQVVFPQEAERQQLGYTFVFVLSMLFYSCFSPEFVNAFTEKAKFDTMFTDEKPAPFLVDLSESFAGLADCKAEFTVDFKKAQQSAGMLAYFSFYH
jgi:hypothetical protein